MKRENKAALGETREKDCITRAATYRGVMANCHKSGLYVSCVELWFDPGNFRDLKISVTLAMKSNQNIGQVLMQRDGGQTRKN